MLELSQINNSLFFDLIFMIQWCAKKRHRVQKNDPCAQKRALEK